MHKILSYFIFGLSLLTANAVYAEKLIPTTTLEETISPEKVALARNLVQIQNVKQQWQDMVLKTFKKNFEYGSADDIAAAKGFTEILNKIDIETEMTQNYATIYSLQELKLLNKFYDTPEGKQIFIKQKQLDKTFEDVFIHHIQQIMVKYDMTT